MRKKVFGRKGRGSLSLMDLPLVDFPIRKYNPNKKKVAVIDIIESKYLR
jgi:hypothetical protein